MSQQGMRPQPPRWGLSEAQLQTAVRKYSQSQQELTELLQARESTPRLARTESESKDREIGELRRKMTGMEAEIQHLRSLITRQSEVMGVQAQAIQQAWQGNAQGGVGGVTQGSVSSPPPRRASSSLVVGRTTSNDGKVFEDRPSGRSTLQRVRQTRVNDFGSPEVVPTQPQPKRATASAWLQTQQSPTDVVGRPNLHPQMIGNIPGEARALMNQHELAARFSSLSMRAANPARPTPAIKPNDPASASETLAVIKYKSEPQWTENSQKKIQQQLNKVFEMTEKYSLAHANFPNHTADALLPQNHKEKLDEIVEAPELLTLMGSPLTRYLVVAKVINKWLIKHILKATTFAGLDQRIDHNIDATKKKIFQSTPASVRFILLNAVANELRKLTENGGFAAYSNCLARERGNQLWTIIKPLMHVKTSRDWDDLFTLMVEAHKLAEMMFTTPNEFKFTFAEVGARFSVLEMVQRDRPPMQRDSSELEATGSRIVLAVAPEVQIRVNDSSGHPYETIIVQPTVHARYLDAPKW